MNVICETLPARSNVLKIARVLFAAYREAKRVEKIQEYEDAFTEPIFHEMIREDVDFPTLKPPESSRERIRDWGSASLNPGV